MRRQLIRRCTLWKAKNGENLITDKFDDQILLIFWSFVQESHKQITSDGDDMKSFFFCVHPEITVKCWTSFGKKITRNICMFISHIVLERLWPPFLFKHCFSSSMFEDIHLYTALIRSSLGSWQIIAVISWHDVDKHMIAPEHQTAKTIN